MTNPNDDMLDDLFATSRAQSAQPGDDLIARVLADASAVQVDLTAPVSAQSPSMWAQMMDAIGGWPSLSGLATATVAGLWIGVAPPNAMQDIAAGYVGDEISVGLLSTSFEFDEGELADG